MLAIGSAALYGAADFLGGLGSRRTNTIAIVVTSQGAGLVTLVLILPLLPAASPSGADLFWGGAAGLGSDSDADTDDVFRIVRRSHSNIRKDYPKISALIKDIADSGYSLFRDLPRLKYSPS